MRFRNLLLILLIGLLSSHSLHGQGTRGTYHYYSVQDGLPSSTLYRTLQDQSGFLWIGSDAGIIRFDGHEFEVFDKQDGLTDIEVFGMEEDRKGRTWLWTYNKKPCYFHQGKFFNDTSDPILRDLEFITSTPPGYYPQYLQGKDGKLYFFIGTSFSFYGNPKPPHQLPDSRTDPFGRPNPWYLAAVNGSGKLMIRNLNLIAQYDPDKRSLDTLAQLNGQIIYPTRNKLFTLNGNTLKVFGPDHSWETITDLPGLDVDFEGFKIFETRRFYWLKDNQLGVWRIPKSEQDGLPVRILDHHFISYVHEDHEGNWWFSTLGDGLIRYTPFEFPVFSSEHGLASDKVHSVLVDSISGAYWVGHDNGTLTRMEPGNNTDILTYTELTDYNRIRDIQMHEGDLYFLGKNNLKRIAQRTGEITDYIRNYTPASLGSMKCFWFQEEFIYVGASTQLSRFSISDETALEVIWKQPVLAGLALSSSTMLVAGNTGLFRLENGDITRLLTGTPFENVRINQIIDAGKKGILLATQDNGILFLAGKTTYHFNTENGLTSNNCTSIASKKDSVIWVGTNNGLNKITFKPASYTIKDVQHIFHQHGIGSNQIFDLHLTDSTLLVGTEKGINLIPSDHSFTEMLPLTRIKQVTFGQTTVGPTDTLQIPYSDTPFQITCSGIAFSNEGKVSYRYRMQGLDAAWTTSQTGVVNYAGLAPGKYVFEVSSANQLGLKYGPPARMFMEVLPGFWQRKETKLLMLVLGFLSLVGLAFLLAKWVRQRERAKALLRQRISSLELQALHAQLNPHFISNTLNSIQHFILERDVRAANEHLNRFSGLMRMYLDHAARQFTSVNEEITLLESYLSLVQLSHEDQFEYQISSPPGLKTVKIPSMILQPLVENAIIHGLLPLKTPGKLVVCFLKTENDVQCTIEDNGIGRQAAKRINESRGRGMVSSGNRILKEKIKALQGLGEQTASIEFLDKVDPNGKALGTKVTVRFTSQKVLR